MFTQKYKFVLIICTFFVLLFMFSIENSHADRLEDLDIHVSLQPDGNAFITEKRTVELSEGTENFLVIENLGKSTIENFVVKEEGTTFEYVDNWDIDATRKEKTFKNGLIETENGYELCWGIGEYGRHTYVVEYTVTNMIKQLEDGQMLFWKFVNDKTNIPPEQVAIEIEADKDLNEETEKVWGFGFPGEAEFVNGKVIVTNSVHLLEMDYVTILIQFADGKFTTSDRLDQTFEEVKEIAFEASDYENGQSTNGSGLIFGAAFIITIFIFLFVGFILIVGVVILLIYKFNTSTRPTVKYPQVFKRKYKEQYYRDFPYDDNFLDSYYILYIMGISNFNTLLTAFLLKWIKEERIRVESDQEKSVFNKRSPKLYILNVEIKSESLEGKLFHMLKEAAGSEEILRKKELAQWADKNRKKLIAWEKNVLDESTNILKKLGYVESMEKTQFFKKQEMYEFTMTGEEIEKKVHQYVNYLHDYSLLNEHEAVNVKIWDEIMIWAALLGQTKVVMKQFTSLYPQYIEETTFTQDTLFLTTAMASSTTPSSSASFGSGGSTSSGGGGGSFGGGSGGGTR